MTDEPAFPVFPESSAGHGSAFRGMSLRDYFAGQYLSAFGGWVPVEYGKSNDRNLVAKSCYEMADAMLQARKQ